jgi:hypothetical protein
MSSLADIVYPEGDVPALARAPAADIGLSGNDVHSGFRFISVHSAITSKTIRPAKESSSADRARGKHKTRTAHFIC